MNLYGSRAHGCRVNEYLWLGHRLIVLENERLRVSVLASKGADIIELRYKPIDLDVLWHAPQSVLPPGQYIPTVARKGGSFLDHYPGGWQEIFPSAGPECVYKGAELGQHGEVSMLPWDVHIQQDTAQRIEVVFTVETVRTPFRLVRRMILEAKQPVLLLREEVTNLGEESLAFQWGHHPTFGAPFLEEGCVIELPKCSAAIPDGAKGMKRRFEVGPVREFPLARTVDGTMEAVNVVRPKSAKTEDIVVFTGLEEGRVSLRNPRIPLRVTMKWDARRFPYLWTWQVYGGSFGYPYYGRTYTLGIEPFNTPIGPLDAWSSDPGAARLGPGQTVTTQYEAEISA
ncbi:MAG: aldose 1-epimerase [Bryobacteraceae bacterium]